jgi:hypothetical protein
VPFGWVGGQIAGVEGVMAGIVVGGRQYIYKGFHTGTTFQRCWVVE